jgi:hypothetical protein
LGAQAASVSPQAVLLSDRRPSGSITVLNPNSAPIEVGLGLRYGYVVSDSSTGRTTVTFVTDSVPANSATRLVRFAPARFRLQPGGSQVVRFVAVTPDDLPEGEYWGRLTVAAAAVSEDGAGEASVRVSGSVNIEVQTVIPLFFRKGRLATALRGTVTSASREGNVVRVQPHFERSGNGVSIGLAKIDVLDAANAVVHTLSRQLAVYNRLDPLYELELPEALAGRAARVRLTVTSARPDLPEGLPLPFSPLVLTTDIVDAAGKVNPEPVPSPSSWESGAEGLVESFGDAVVLAPGDDAAPDESPPPSSIASDALTGWYPSPRLVDASPPRSVSDSTRTRYQPSIPVDTIASRAPSPDPPTGGPGDGTLAILAVLVGDEELGTLLTEAGTAPDRPLIPLTRFAALIGGRVESDRSGTQWRLTLQTMVPTIATLDVATGRATRQRGGVRLESRTFTAPFGRRVRDEWFVELAVLEWLTTIALHVDAPTASLLLDVRRERLPRFAAEIGRRDRGSIVTDQVLSAPRRDDERLHWSGWKPAGLSATYLHSVDNQLGDFASAMTLGTTVLGGGLAMDVRATRSGSVSRTLTDLSWMGGAPTNRWLRQWRLGSGSATGPIVMAGRGIALSNSPFLRSTQLGAMTRSGTAPPGAEIELSRNGQVIGVTLADSSGRWSLPMPIDFGQNTIEIAVYTPNGVTRNSALLTLEQDLIPARTIEYGFTLQDNNTADSDCRRRVGPCGLVGNADVRVGLSARYTARAGVYEMRPEGSAFVERVPYAAMVASPLDWVQVRGEGTATGWWRARAIVQPSLHVRLEAGGEAVDSTRVPFWLQQQAQFRTAERSAGLTIRPLRDLGKAWLSSQWRGTNGPRGRAEILTSTVGARLGRTLVQGTYDRVVSNDPLGGRFLSDLRGATLTLPQIPRGPVWLRRSFVSLGTSADAQWRLRYVTGQLSASLGRQLFVQGGLDWLRGAGAPSFRAQLQYQGSLTTLFQDMASGVRGRVQSTTTIMGTAVVGGRGEGVRLSGDFVALRARVSGVAFEDRNRNGRFDPGEPRLSDVSIRVGGQAVMTDAQGRFLISGLPVMDALPVSAGTEATLSADGRVLVPAVTREWAMLVPFGETRIDFAFVEERSEVRGSAAPSTGKVP